MIELINGYFIDGQKYDYALRKRTGKFNKYNEEITKIIGFHPNVEACIKDCYKDSCIEIVQTEKLTLFQALDAFKKLESDLIAVIPQEFKKGGKLNGI